MYRATWLLKDGTRVQSRDYLTLDQIDEYTFKGERVLALEGVSALLEAPARVVLSVGNVEFVWGGG